MSAQPWYNGGYRANIVAYTLAVLSEITRRQGNAVDFGRIWNAQAVNGTLEATIAVVARAVNEEIIKPPLGISNISEWCKKDACWSGLLIKIPEFETLLSEEFLDELLSADEKSDQAKTAKQTQRIDNGIEAQKKVLGIAGEEWAKVYKALSAKRLLSTKEAGVLQIAMQMPLKIPTEKQCVVLLETIEKARLEGLVID